LLQTAKFTNEQALTIFLNQEVTTITLSAQVFGDEITPVNMMGVGVTFIGVLSYYICAVGTSRTDADLSIRDRIVRVSQISEIGAFSDAAGCAWEPDSS